MRYVIYDTSTGEIIAQCITSTLEAFYAHELDPGQGKMLVDDDSLWDRCGLYTILQNGVRQRKIYVDVTTGRLMPRD